jgi:arabinose-5-phosphate isomerase
VEADALQAMAARIDASFERAVDLILASKGRVVVSGMGKSGLIGQKIASTMASTGTPALFLHPAEGIHGDLGMIMTGDVVIAISNSGETEEMLRILPAIKRIGAHVVAMTSNEASTMARSSDVFLDVSVREEACPLGLAPTASTTAALAMGDALAVALLVQRGFRAEDFAIFHPGGSLGKKLLLRVEDLMHSGEAIPLVFEDTLMKEALFVITAKGLGVTGVTAADGALCGVITDGDLRRALEKGYDILGQRAAELMKLNPLRIRRHELAAAALQVMEHRSITSLFVFEDENSPAPCGIIHLHDILRAGIA